MHAFLNSSNRMRAIGSMGALGGVAAIIFLFNHFPYGQSPVAGILLTGMGLLLTLACFVVFLPRLVSLPMQILTAMITGIVCGSLGAGGEAALFIQDYLGIFGKLFILLLTMIIVPLIFMSVLNGTAGIGDPRKLGSLGVKSLLYYLGTTALAVLIGLALVNSIQPGRGQDALRLSSETPVEQTAALPVKTDLSFEATAQAPLPLGRRIQEQILPAVIRNPIMAGENPIVIIFFAILLGAALAAIGREGEPALKAFRSLDQALVIIVLWVMRLAPVGVFSLMTRAVSELGIGYMLTLAKYFFTVMLGLSIHFLALSCILCPLLARISPLRFWRGMAPALQLAFSTSSSSATLPTTIECATKRMGADPNICSFMLPVGATINMDGTALYLTVASLFVAQVYGLDLGLQAQFMVFLTAVLASVGTAGIPGASIGLMGIIFASAGIPVEGIAIVIGVDRLLDMSRTVVNVTGDSVGAIAISYREGSLKMPDQSLK